MSSSAVIYEKLEYYQKRYIYLKYDILLDKITFIPVKVPQLQDGTFNMFEITIWPQYLLLDFTCITGKKSRTWPSIFFFIINLLV